MGKIIFKVKPKKKPSANAVKPNSGGGTIPCVIVHTEGGVKPDSSGRNIGKDKPIKKGKPIKFRLSR